MAKREVIRIATFNLFNLISPDRPYYGNRRLSQEDYTRKKRWINQQLDNMNADVIGFQELFDEKAIRDVVKDNPNYRNAHIAVGHNKEGLPFVGLLSKFPITEKVVFDSFPEQLEVDGMIIPFTNFSRPILQARVQIRPDISIVFIVAHLKSKRPMIKDNVDRNDPIEIAKGQARSLFLRTAESCALRTILMSTLKDREDPVVVIGDLNDTHTSVTTRIVSGDPPFRQWPLEKKLEIWDVLLYHTKDIQARTSFEDVYYTHIHNGHYEALDHIMVSEELVRENPDHIGRVGVVQIYNDHLIDETLSDEKVPYWKSDHAQVVVTIELNLPTK